MADLVAPWTAVCRKKRNLRASISFDSAQGRHLRLPLEFGNFSLRLAKKPANPERGMALTLDLKLSCPSVYVEEGEQRFQIRPGG